MIVIRTATTTEKTAAPTVPPAIAPVCGLGVDRDCGFGESDETEGMLVLLDGA